MPLVFVHNILLLFDSPSIEFVILISVPRYCRLWVNSLVGADTGSFQSLGGQLFVLVGDQVDAERELVNVRTLSAKVEDSNLGVRYTTVESGLWVGLEA